VQSVHLTDPTVLGQGNFSGVRLDPYRGNLAASGTPALVADIDPATGAATAVSGTGTLAGTWVLSGGTEVTTSSGSTWTYVTSADALDLQYQTATIGAIAHVTVDGQPRKGFDSSNTATNVWRLYLDGQQHTVVVTYSGDAVVGTPLLGTPADSGGTAGLAASLRLARTGDGVAGQTWTVAAQGTTAVGVFSPPTIAAPASAPTGTPASTGGSVPAGGHTYVVTYVNPTGETAAGTATGTVTTSGTTSSVALTAVPTGPTGTTARKVYRADGGAYGLVLTIADNTTATGTDTAASLGAAPPSSGTALTLAGSLATGQTSTALLPGVALSLVAGSWDATSKATVTITAPTLGLTNVTPYTGLSATATYTSPVLDSGDALAQWPLLEARQGLVGTPAPTLQFGVGQSATPDATWTWQALTPTVVADPDGNPWQRVVYAGPPSRGRFAQFIGGLNDQTSSWVSDLRAFWWVPETDPFRRLFPAPTYRGQGVTAPLLAALAALFAYVDEQADDLLAGAAFTSAYDGYLTAYGLQFATPRLQGEGDSAYRSRLSTLFSGRQQGGSKPFLQATLSGALGCVVAVGRTARSSSAFVLGTSALGTQGLGQTATGYWQYTVTIPFADLQVSPETAQQIVAQLRPVGAIVSILYS